MLLLEIDIHQGECVKELLYAAGYDRVTIVKDVHKRDRVAWAFWV